MVFGASQMFVFLRLDLYNCRFEYVTNFIIVRLTRDLAEQFPVRMILRLSENYICDRVDFHCWLGSPLALIMVFCRAVAFCSATLLLDSHNRVYAANNTYQNSFMLAFGRNSRNFCETVVSVTICRANSCAAHIVFSFLDDICH
jgi:hypothetical protein